MRRASKRFDALRAGDQVSVLGTWLTVVEVHGGSSTTGNWGIKVAADVRDWFKDSILSFPPSTWVGCLSDERPPFTQSQRHMHPARVHRIKPLQREFEEFLIYSNGRYYTRSEWLDSMPH